MLKRTSLNSINKKLKENPNWNILDIGCGYTANSYANVVADVQDLSSFYKNKKFIKINNKKLPFKDNEFDFVVTSHVIEHVEDFEFFIKEIERVSKQGYIELPTRLGDNLVFENLIEHIWWFKYDDEMNLLLASRKNQIIEPFITVSTSKKLDLIFRESFVLELLWEKKIDFIIDNNIGMISTPKINFKNLIKKYFSKKFRQFLTSFKSK
ncbi:class I SAM-dependent methyltransferase [Pelagibacteraceae bacterium]|nr:class I SAM-dependent methyltransferase [Pelagibacteraceae bacterium]